ncbi:tRNA epoxyqueuosine(34) reductase QueG [Aestuariibius insulae]|uniref:tRNA epoxyqueuosine(34) reductase QueG n=1 Tax=Aestuariibius insulae TaxID=2058287 RepID=UPI00345EFDEC
MSEDLKATLTSFALEAGFSAVGICRPTAVPQLPERLNTFLETDRHGQMAWMAERTHWRSDPAALWSEARSVIMMAESYTPDYDPLDLLSLRDRGAISVYAGGRDYHDVVKKRLKRVGRWLLEQAPGEQIKVFVDTAPVMEKPLAEAAGLGWQGKHTNLLSRDLGNWFFLGAIFTTLDLPPDRPGEEHCGSCRACLDICPTEAFPAPFQLDARRCISYLTIEHHGPVDEDLRPALGNRIYGCDDCLAVCPWNKFAATARDQRLSMRPELKAPSLSSLAALTDPEFRTLFSGSPIKRIGRNRFVRNVAYAIGNSGDGSLASSVGQLTDDPDPAVADAARWAAVRLAKAD